MVDKWIELAPEDIVWDNIDVRSPSLLVYRNTKGSCSPDDV